MNIGLQPVYKKMLSLYSESVPTAIFSRFYSEKAMLEGRGNYLTLLGLAAKLREKAREKGEHVRLRGSAGNLLVAWLLGASEIDPTEWDLPFEMELSHINREWLQIEVSHAFFAEAKKLLTEWLADEHALVTLCDGDVPTLTWLVPLDMGEESKTLSFKEDRALFQEMPHLALAPSMVLDQYREIEQATGVKMEEAHGADDMEVLQAFLQGDVRGIPRVDSPNGFVGRLIEGTKPQRFAEVLQIIGLSHGTGIWKGNGDKLFAEHRLALREIPVFAEDIYREIAKKLREQGIRDTGFALEVAQKARLGAYQKAGGMDEAHLHALLDLGFDLDWIFVLENTMYSLPKAQCIGYLVDAKALMWYKLNYPSEYDRIFVPHRGI